MWRNGLTYQPPLNSAAGAVQLKSSDSMFVIITFSTIHKGPCVLLVFM